MGKSTFRGHTPKFIITEHTQVIPFPMLHDDIVAYSYTMLLPTAEIVMMH